MMATKAERIIMGLLRVLTNRKGFDAWWDEIDVETKRAIRAEMQVEIEIFVGEEPPPGRHSIVYLPPEPDRENSLVQEISATGLVSRTWWWCSEGWIDVDPDTLDEEERPEYFSDAHSWAWLVSDAIGQRLRLITVAKEG